MLAVHGKRSDGFHELTSLVAALKFGDTLVVRIADTAGDSLQCSNPAVPLGAENLILKAAAEFRARLKEDVYFEFDLKKRIPMGAGFGGGSGNAVAALNGMNQLTKAPLSRKALCEIAAGLGSDCPFFLEARPSRMRGRGESIEPLEGALARRLQGMPVILIKPEFEVDTTWAYRRLAAGAPESYQKEAIDTAYLEESISAGKMESFLSNSFEKPVGEKYLAIPTLLEQLRASGVSCLMSGSGSGCFVLPGFSSLAPEQIKAMVQDAWGESVFWVETSIH